MPSWHQGDTGGVDAVQALNWELQRPEQLCCFGAGSRVPQVPSRGRPAIAENGVLGSNNEEEMVPGDKKEPSHVQAGDPTTTQVRSSACYSESAMIDCHSQRGSQVL